MTNDGELANRLTHPRYGVEKTYYAVLDGPVDDAGLRRLARGVQLDDGMTAPARVGACAADAARRYVARHHHPRGPQPADPPHGGGDRPTARCASNASGSAP